MMKKNMNASAAANAVAAQITPANQQDTDQPNITPRASLPGIKVDRTLDIMALAYCIAEAKDMDVKVVHDLLVTAVDFLHRDGVDGIWGHVKQLVEESNEDHVKEISSAASDRCLEGHPAIFATTSVDDVTETPEEAYEIGYRIGQEDGESGFGMPRAERENCDDGRDDLDEAYRVGYELGYEYGRQVDERIGLRTKRSDAECYYYGYDVEHDESYDNYDDFD